jgi:hypothetical protein
MNQIRDIPINFPTFAFMLLSYPLGILMHKTLPDVTVPLGPLSFSLNPGPFNVKEVTLIAIFGSTGTQQVYAISNLMGRFQF